LHSLGQNARRAVEETREQVAEALGARPREVIFTGSGTESDNLAIKGVAHALRERDKGNHIITSETEHHAVLHACQALEREGFDVTYLSVDEHGFVNVESLRLALREDTILVSIMHGNNEIGTIEPIAELAAIAKESGVVFHTDGVQTFGHQPTPVGDLNVDLLSLSAHKIYGPKGVGALYVRSGVRLQPLMSGGGQERKLRAGTENVAGIVGLGAAVARMREHGEKEAERMRALRDKLIAGVLENIPRARLTGHPTKRLDNSASFCFDYVEGESMLLLLDAAGIAASSGSACTSGSLDPSHVLLAIGLPHEVAHGSLRLTLGKDNTEEEIDTVLETLPGIVTRLREMSPMVPAGSD
ncbi:MAG: cysteine desulfurase family protein, partial [Armatimonadota bacterium]